jgi:hypothetical protein
MSNHVNDNQIERYRSRQLGADEVAAVDSHLRVCAECGDRLVPPKERRSKMLFLMTEWGSPAAHLSYEQLERYVEKSGTNEERAAVDAHTKVCARCRGDLEDLQSYREGMADEIRDLNTLIASAPAAQVSAPPARQTGAIRRSWIRNLSYAGSGAIAAGLLLVFWQVGPLKYKLDQTERASKSLISPAVFAKEKQRSEELDRQHVRDQKAIARMVKENSSLDDEKTHLTKENQELARRAAKPGPSGPLWVAPEEARRVEVAMNTTNLRLPDIATLTDPARSVGPIARGGDAFGPTEPVGTDVISTMPELKWNGFPAADKYRIMISEIDGGGAEKPLKPKEVDKAVTSWTVETPLTRGKVYRWQVLPLTAEGATLPAPDNLPARFRVLSPEKARSYLKVQLRNAVLAAENGLFSDAQSILQQIQDAHGDREITAKAVKLAEDLQKKRPK